MYRLVPFAIAVLLSGCASSGPEVLPGLPEVPTVEAPAPTETPAPNAMDVEEPKDLPLEIHYVRNSAEYKALFEQTYRLATAALEERVVDRESGTWAVVVDADETLIGNSEQSKERALGNGSPYFEEDWDQWVNRRAAPALPGAREFLARVHELGGRIAVVTNRRDKHCPQTTENLQAIGMPFDVILCRSETRDKEPRWTSVEDGTAAEDLPPLEIVMWVGDNIHDFPGGDQDLRFSESGAFEDFGSMYFILPNPLYGSWEDNSQD